MSHLTNIMKKEIREMLTPGSVISVLVMVVIFAGLGGMINGEVDKASELPYFGIVGGADGDFDGWNIQDALEEIYGEEAYKIVVFESVYGDRDAIIAEMESTGTTSVIAIPNDVYTRLSAGEQVAIMQYYLYEPSGMFGSVSSTVVSSIVSILNSDLSAKLIADAGYNDYAFITNPLVTTDDNINTIIDGVAHQGVTPFDISNEITSQTMMVPLVIMIIIMMVGSIVISSMGSEKENKTLETLLTMPIKRTTIVSGKIAAAAIVGLVYGLAYMAGMSIYMGSMMGSMDTGSVNLEELGMALDITDWVLIMLSMFLAIICALGICMILGAFAKNYKSAQTMTMPMSILAIIPMFIVMFSGWYGAGSVLQAVTFIIPFSHPMLAMQALMYGDIMLVLAGIAYMAVFAAASILITVWLYRSDILITGLGQNKLIQKLSGRK